MSYRAAVRTLAVFGFLAAICAVVSLSPAQEPEDRKGSRTAFMRQKLEFAKEMLDGLATEDFEKIDKNAKLLKKLSIAAEWEVPTMPNATEYIAETNEFQRDCDAAVKAAKDKNIDGATLAYVRMTTTCVSCHKYVRSLVK